VQRARFVRQLDTGCPIPRYASAPNPITALLGPGEQILIHDISAFPPWMSFAATTADSFALPASPSAVSAAVPHLAPDTPPSLPAAMTFPLPPAPGDAPGVVPRYKPPAPKPPHGPHVVFGRGASSKGARGQAAAAAAAVAAADGRVGDASSAALPVRGRFVAGLCCLTVLWHVSQPRP